MTETARKLKADYADLDVVYKIALGEMARWKTRIAADKGRPRLLDDEREGLTRQTELAAALEDALIEAGKQIEYHLDEIEKSLAELGKVEPQESFRKIRDAVGKDFRGRLSEVFVAQTQARVFLIELPRVDLKLDEAIEIAFENRLDLMNSQANVTDLWRQVEVDANALRGGLNLVYQGNLANNPKKDDIIRFDASASTHRFGVQFDAPLNRRAERNVYRADQINYQRARRAYMQTHDTILQQIRLDMRQLNLFRRQFAIQREQLLINSRQVDQAEFDLRNSSGTAAGAVAGSSAAINLLTVLNQLLQTKNSLITTWVNYETQRMTLYQHFDIMDINAEGVWTNEPNGATAFTVGRDDPGAGGPAFAPPPPVTPGPFVAPTP